MSTLVMHPAAVAAGLFDIVDRVFGDRGSDTGTDTGTEPSATMQLRTDVSEEETRYAIAVDIPGMAKEEVSIKVEGGKVFIEGERQGERKGKYHRAERAYGRFLRSFTLPDNVDAEKIEAKMANGVLELSLPKNQKAQPIEVKIS